MQFRNPFKKKAKPWQFKKGNRAGARENRPVIDVDQDLMAVVLQRAKAGDSSMARLYLDHTDGGERAPTRIVLFMPLADGLDRYPDGLEGAYIKPERDITLDASVPLTQRQILGVGDGLTPEGVPTVELLADIAKLSPEQQATCTARPIEQWKSYVDRALKP